MIQTLEDLHQHLMAAVQLELSVIPPYLCALYTLHPGTNQEVAEIIRSVLVEEMLHMVLAANVLNAVGGQPRIATPDFAPRYPAYLPDGERKFKIHLLPFSREAVETFLKVEEPSYQPSPVLTASAGSTRTATPLRVAEIGPYATVGEFYQAIVDGLTYLVERLGEKAVFSGDPERQVTPEYYYGGGGTAIVVRDLTAAREALLQIVDQGEGETRSMYDADGDLAHFFRFMEIKYRRRYAPEQKDALHAGSFDPPAGEAFAVDYATVYPMLADPHLEDYPEGELREAVRAFDALYSELLRQLERSFDGAPDQLLPAVGTMFALKYKALELLKNPLPGRPGLHAGPVFAYVHEER